MDKSRPAISVIMPVYNTEAYVDLAIQSVMAQTFPDFELLLINDGSTDNSLPILQDWSRNDTRVKIFSQENQGLSAARNTGMMHASGSYIYFMDSDDLIIPTTLSSCYAICEKQELDFVFFDADVFDSDLENPALLSNFNYQRKHFTPHRVMSGKAAFDHLLHNGEFFSSVCLLFIQRDFLNQINLTFQKGIVHEDQLFTSLLFLKANQVVYIPTAFFLRRVRMDSIMTASYAMKNMQSYWVVGHQLLQYAKKDKAIQPLVDLYVRGMIDAAVWKAYLMPLKDRLRIFIVCLRDWRPYVKWKTFMVLLFKKYK